MNSRSNSFTSYFMMKTLGDKIRYYRNLNNWSQEELADMINITSVSLSNIERNVTDINYSRLKQIADIFKISVSELTHLNTKPSEQLDLQKTIKEQQKEIIRLQKTVIRLQGKSRKK
jgi:transcriptional regulator with XRE-family HTH domain